MRSLAFSLCMYVKALARLDTAQGMHVGGTFMPSFYPIVYFSFLI